MRRDLTCPTFLGRARMGATWGGGRALCAEPRGLLCVITEDIPVEQEELISEACHLVTFISAASASTGSV